MVIAVISNIRSVLFKAAPKGTLEPTVLILCSFNFSIIFLHTK